MRRFLPLSTIAFAVLLAACGTVSEGDRILGEMHRRYTEHIISNSRFITQPETGSVDTSFEIHTLPVKDLFPGTVDLTASTVTRYDIRSPKSPVADGNLALTVSVKAPAGTFGMPSASSAQDEMSLDLLLNARAVSRTLLVNIAKLDADIPAFMPMPFSLPPVTAAKWFGATFDELNRKMKEGTEGMPDSGPVPTVEEMITSAFAGARVTPEALRRAADRMHLWNAVEVLPEKDGQLQVRVESDKEKIHTSVRAVMEYIEEVSGPSWEQQLRNPEFEEIVTGITEEDAEFLKTMGSVKGVLSVDKETYVLTGFEGDVFDETGKQSGRISFASRDGDVTLAITDTESGETATFTKKGGDLLLTTGDKTVVAGTWDEAKKELSLTVSDPETGVKAATLFLSASEFTPERSTINKLEITLVEEKVTITITDAGTILDAEAGSADITGSFTVTLEGKKVAEGRLETSSRTLTPFSVEKPSFSPFEDLQADFMQALMGGGAPGDIPLE